MQIEQKIVHYALQDWGAWEETQLEKSAYAATTPLYRYVTEGNCGKPIFKSLILHTGTPQEILKTRQAIEKLSEQQKDIITVHYVFQIKPTGGLWTVREKAEKMGFSYDSWRKNIERARSKLYAFL